jgi:hypothetical protein
VVEICVKWIYEENNNSLKKRTPLTVGKINTHDGTTTMNLSFSKELKL